MTASNRKKVLITGAAGGMGRACARLIGLTHDLVLGDVNAEAMAGFAAELERDAYTVSGTVAGDTCDAAVLSRITVLLGGGAAFDVIHTAGVSPSQGDWETIMRVNLAGTALLLQSLDPLVVPGTTAVLIASTAGHLAPAIPEADAVMAAALEPDLAGRMKPFIDGITAQAGVAMAGGISYTFSKRGVLRLGERKAAEWGPKGGRVVTISPGLMLTPMGRSELASTPGAQATMDAAPVGRPGTAMDIAMAARFLLSDEASFISGSDVRVDGGSVSNMLNGMGR